MPKFGDRLMNEESPKEFLRELEKLTPKQVDKQWDDIVQALFNIPNIQDRFNLVNVYSRRTEGLTPDQIPPDMKKVDKKIKEWFADYLSDYKAVMMDTIMGEIDGDLKKLPKVIEQFVSQVIPSDNEYGKLQIDMLKDEIPYDIEIDLEESRYKELKKKKKEGVITNKEAREWNKIIQERSGEPEPKKETKPERPPFDNARYKQFKKKKDTEGLTAEEQKEWEILKREKEIYEKIPKIKPTKPKPKPKEDEEPVMPPPVAVDISDQKGIPNALKSIKNAESVEEWLGQASICRVVLDKEDFSKDSFYKVLSDKFDEYKYECGFRLNVTKDDVELVSTDRKKSPVTPETLAVATKDCDEFICYVSVRKDPSRHANLIVLRDKVLYRFDPKGEEGSKSKIQDDFLEKYAKIKGVDYMPVAESCPRFGVQHKALKISRIGLCNIWALLFIDIFLINKKMNLPQVEALFEKLSPEQLSNVMFNYYWSIKSEMLGGGLNAKKVQHFSSASYKKNKDIKGIGNYRLDNSLSTNEAKVFVNKDTGKVVVANRGTAHTLKDWTNNLSLLLGQYKNTARYKNARDIQVKVLEKYPEFQVLNVGHSQGAAITKRLNEEGLTGEIININPASLPTDRKKDNETTIRSSGDIVSMYDRPKKGDIMLKAKSLNPFEEHRTTIVGELPPKTYIGKGHYSKFEWFD